RFHAHLRLEFCAVNLAFLNLCHAAFLLGLQLKPLSRFRGPLYGEARSRAARAEFERTLLSALQDVENAYLGWHTQHAALEHQAEGVAVAERQLDRSRRLFEAGQVDATVVAEAEAGVLSAQASLIRTRAETAMQWGVLAKALSGSPV
ncbi:TolC family protein, partial [Pseudomonas aeruginosa]